MLIICGEKLSQLQRLIENSWENFHGCIVYAIPYDYLYETFAGKLSR